MKTFGLVLMLCLLSTVVTAQRHPIVTPEPTAPRGSHAFGEFSSSGGDPFPSLRRTAQRRAGEWEHLIDSLWGEGVSTPEKLSVFDTYWNLVDQTWGGFPNLDVNWDSLGNVYRPLISAGVSRGRFYGILCRLTRALNEWHVFVRDRGIDGTVGYYPDSPDEYPNYPSFQYRPGLPIINSNVLTFRTTFGAGLTPLPDSTAVVYNVMPNHPLGLQPGDIILGYNGIPWRQLITMLFDAELPILGGGNLFGSSPDAQYHVAMVSAGMNWGLFDTIDVVKYHAKDTVHLPTSLLNSITPPYFVATEQLPVNGVPFPDIENKKLVSWGVVEGTAVGYIYAWDWWGMPVGESRTLFAQAVDELVHEKRVTGLVLDFRTNAGGWPEYANDGYGQLFNFDPTLHYSSALRVRGGPRLSFTLTSHLLLDAFSPGRELFDHPIAVLTGPLCGSSGDYNAFKMRFHPMARFFGKRTNGAFTSWSNRHQYGTLLGPYFCDVDDASVYSNYDNEGFMIHKSFPVDEEVWLTRDGVAKGEDDVVKRAMEWITTLSYAHDVTIDRVYYPRPGVDTVSVTAVLANPEHHTAALSAIVTEGIAAQVDSVPMYNDGLHGDGSAGDSVWGCQIRVPSHEGLFGVSVRTDDLTQGTYRRLTKAVRFATAGPLTLDSVGVIEMLSGYRLKPYLRNEGTGYSVPKATARLSCNDPWVRTIGSAPLDIPELAPGATLPTLQVSGISLDAASFQGYINLKVEVAVDGWVYWQDSMRVFWPGVSIVEGETFPATFALLQSYPNPSNPGTTIRFQLPQASMVRLSVYDMLGLEVSVLVNERRDAGVHEVRFDGSNLASGVYVYRIQAGEFVHARNFIVLK